MIVTIDGPAGAGKSTIARALAKRLGFRFLDTGAMYRAVAWAALSARHDWQDPRSLAKLAEALDICITPDAVHVNGTDVTQAIRTSEVTAVTHYAANNPAVREILGQRQRQFAQGNNIVTEGRDQGTVVFPLAECKIYLTASPEERARRRAAELSARGQTITAEEVLAAQNRRDASDANRDVAPMIAAADAIEVVTDGLGPEQVVDRLESLVQEKSR